MEVLVLGAGYVGLVQAAGLASAGNDVNLIDISKEKIELLEAGGCPIFEPGLKELLSIGHGKGYLKFYHSEGAEFLEKMLNADICFIAVGTPQGSDGHADLKYLYSAAEMLLKLGSKLNNKLLVIKSTVPVGTGDKIEEFFRSKGFSPKIVSNPEFLKQGAAVQDFLKPERVIVGTDDEEAKKILHFLYKPFMMKRERLVFMSRKSAELVKYACNAFLATKISFINEISRLSELVGADIQEIREGMISDSRIGDQFLFPGIGYGGSCLPKDTQALMAQGKAAGISMGIVEATDRVNQYQKNWMLEKISKYFKGELSGRTITVWGLSFKPNTDDLRDAPSVYLLKDLFKAGAKVHAHDPAAMDNIRVLFKSEIDKGSLKLFDNPYEAAAHSNVLAVLTEWQEYRTPNLKKLAKLLSDHTIFDGRDIYENAMLKKFGFTHYGVGMV
ncbi:MAG: nucleotide sugar dehydrogenase [Bacteriovoracaceae bacterium]|nr:nucleotide sugar dehydrogenase [Bacteriovoracaceae bacterium]